MKKIALILALIICFSSFVGCSSDESAEKGKDDTKATATTDGDKDIVSTIETEEIAEFIGFIVSGDYAKAVSCFQEKILGNMKLETEAGTEVKNLLVSTNKGVLDGTKTDVDAKNTVATIDKVVAQTSISVEGYDALKTDINNSVASKAAFAAAKELETLGNYADAIASYKEVVETDSNYQAAQTAITTCATALKDAAFAEAQKFAGEKDYLSALKELDKVKKVLPDDSDVISKITVYEKTYFEYVIKSADEVFVTPATDYLKALEVINAALQHYPDNENLNEKKAYYQSYTPVNLYDLEEMGGTMYYEDTDKDIYGNSYVKSFLANDFGGIKYNLDKQYNTFSCVVYARSKLNYDSLSSVEIFLDGKAAYQKFDISDENTRPYEITIDVTGVTEMKIVIGSSVYMNKGIGMSNMILQKTVK